MVLPAVPLVAVLPVLLALVAFYNFYWKRRNLPPGPMPWPILGNLLPVFHDKSGYRIFRQWADQYGPVFTVWWAEEPYIVIADYALMKEAYVRNAEAFNGRHILPIAHILSEANHSAGVARINGEHWRELRRLSMKILRDLGVGRNTMQERILPTVKAILRKLDTYLAHGAHEHNMLPCLNFFTANVISELTFATGYYGENDKHYERMMHLSEIIHSNFTSIFGLLMALMPFLRHFPFFKHTYNKMNGPWEEFHAFFESGIQKRIEQRKQMGDGGRRQSVEAAARKSSGGTTGTAETKCIRKHSNNNSDEQQPGHWENQQPYEQTDGSRKTSRSNEHQSGRRKTSGNNNNNKPVGVLKQSQNIQQTNDNNNNNGGQQQEQEVVGIFQQQPPRKFSGSAAGRKVSHVQWSVVVTKEGTSECFVDLFLDKLEENGADKFINMDSLRGMCFDLFVGGQEPTASTLGFMIIYMLLDQQRQKKLHAELDAFAAEQGWNGGEWEDEEWIELADRPKLPYLNAVINETQRIGNLLPMNLTHMTNYDTHIGEHPIPKGIAIIAQMSCLFCDPKIFPEPEKFIPERFIDENGQLRKCDELIPFSLGKRNCIGEGLARAELFLFAANFFNKFHVLPTDPLRPPSIEKKVYFTSMPIPYRCCLVRRQRHQSPAAAAALPVHNVSPFPSALSAPLSSKGTLLLSTIASASPCCSSSSLASSSSSDEETTTTIAPAMGVPSHQQQVPVFPMLENILSKQQQEKFDDDDVHGRVPAAPMEQSNDDDVIVDDDDANDDVNVAKQRQRGSSFLKCQEQQKQLKRRER